MSACPDCEGVVTCHPTCMLKTNSPARIRPPKPPRKRARTSGRIVQCQGCGKDFADKRPSYREPQPFCSQSCRLATVKTQIWKRKVAMEAVDD